jgi:serine/threonine protein kinase
MKSSTTKRGESVVKLITRLLLATHPEDVFGELISDKNETLAKVFRDLAARIHPDVCKEKKAEEAFKKLGEWREEAEKKLERGTYGNRDAFKEVVITTKKESYTIDARLTSGEICEIYTAKNKANKAVIVKVPRSPVNNDLMKNEADKLRWLQEEARTRNLDANIHVIKLLDSFELDQKSQRKQVNVFEALDGFYTLEEVRTAYPDGIDVRDAAWMWRRLLTGLMIPQQAELIHGGIVPNNVLISPSDHNGKIVDWCYAVKTGLPLKAVSSKYAEFYPSEVFEKKPLNISTDIYMAAMCFLYLIGGNPKIKSIPTKIHFRITGLVRACLLGPRSRIDSAIEVYDDFGEVLKKLYGIKFRAFSMPTRNVAS